MADNKIAMQRYSGSEWDEIYFSAHANMMGLDSSETTTNVGTVLQDILNNPSSIEENNSPILEDCITCIDLLTKNTLFESSIKTPPEEAETVSKSYMPYAEHETPIHLLYRLHGKNLENVKYSEGENGLYVSGVFSSGAATVVTTENVDDLSNAYAFKFEIGDIIVVSSITTTEDVQKELQLRMSLSEPVKVYSDETMTTEASDIVSSTIKFIPATIRCRFLNESGETINKSGSVIEDSSGDVQINETGISKFFIPKNTKTIRPYVRLGVEDSPDSNIDAILFHAPVGDEKCLNTPLFMSALASTDITLGGSVKYRQFTDVVLPQPMFGEAEIFVSTGVTKKEAVTFETLDNIKLEKGVWNKAAARLEF